MPFDNGRMTCYVLKGVLWPWWNYCKGLRNILMTVIFKKLHSILTAFIIIDPKTLYICAHAILTPQRKIEEFMSGPIFILIQC